MENITLQNITSNHYEDNYEDNTLIVLLICMSPVYVPLIVGMCMICCHKCIIFCIKRYKNCKKINQIQQIIINLPINDIPINDIPSQNNVCQICHKKTNDNLLVLSCKHEFHLECITQWFIQSTTCTICRTSVINIINNINNINNIKKFIEQP